MKVDKVADMDLVVGKVVNRVLNLSVKCFVFLGEFFWSHMAGAPEGRERRSQADPMGPKPVRVRGRGSGVGVPGSGSWDPGGRPRSRGPTGP